MKEKKFFPLFMDLEDKKIVVFGGGKVASRRIHSLQGFGGRLLVIAPQIDDDLLALAGVDFLVRGYQKNDCQGAFLVLAATDNPSVNEAIAQECREKGILFNTAHQKELCNFYFPALMEEDGFLLALTSQGKDHGLVKRLAGDLRRFLYQWLEEEKFEDNQKLKDQT
ncbi:MAG: bifunctional precorrin-2 dehydrogenase/sirohydrochlorin ferrochelatase [Clostridiales bacterium]